MKRVNKYRDGLRDSNGYADEVSGMQVPTEKVSGMQSAADGNRSGIAMDSEKAMPVEGMENFMDGMENKELGLIEEDRELEELRQEVRELKRELSKSRITNDKVLRKAMREQSGWLGRLVKFEIWSLPFITLVLAAFSYGIGATLWPIAVFFVIAVICTWLDWYTMRIAPSYLLDMPMLELKECLVKQKRYRMIQTVVESVITFLWLSWYLYSVKVAITPGSEFAETLKYTVLTGSVIGGIIAVVVIVMIYRKAQKTNNELIDSIEDAEK